MKSYSFILFFAILLATSLSAQVNINEVVYDPNTGNNDGGNSAGEWIELFGTAGTDISCFVITDGDWTITIPSGTTIPADGFFVIGKATFANTPGANGTTAVDLDVETCGCTTGSRVMELTNGGESVGLYDPSAVPTLIDGIIFESPSTGNSPAGESAINSLAITGCPVFSADIPGNAASYESVGAGSGAGFARNADGSGTWEYIASADATPNATNSSALPIDLISFDGNLVGKNVELFWTTASEVNNNYFEIEHSIDGNQFKSIGRVTALGTLFSNQSYAFTHTNAPNGINYYRLNQFDYNGRNTFSDAVAIENIYISDGDQIQVYPTLVENDLTIKSNTPFGKNDFVGVYSISGQMIYQQELSEGNRLVSLVTSDWHKGHYVLRVMQNGIPTTKRIIK